MKPSWPGQYLTFFWYLLSEPWICMCALICSHTQLGYMHSSNTWKMYFAREYVHIRASWGVLKLSQERENWAQLSMLFMQIIFWHRSRTHSRLLAGWMVLVLASFHFHFPSSTILSSTPVTSHVLKLRRPYLCYSFCVNRFCSSIMNVLETCTEMVPQIEPTLTLHTDVNGKSETDSWTRRSCRSFVIL